MKIILSEKVNNLGNLGDIVKVNLVMLEIIYFLKGKPLEQLKRISKFLKKKDLKEKKKIVKVKIWLKSYLKI